MRSAKQILKKFLRFGVYLSFLFISSLCLLELIYRFQLVDFYKTELKILNPNLHQDYPNGNVLIFGDSFSGFPNGYVEQLRVAYPETNFINCAIAGTGLKQHSLFYKSRIQKFNPKQILYQFYVGNDLLDISQDVKIENTDFLIASYHLVSEHFVFLKYLNYKLAGFKNKPKKEIDSKEFVSYNSRVKNQFSSNPYYLKETIENTGRQAQKLEEWIKLFQELNGSNKIPTSLLILPHCAQVETHYLEKMKSFGAALDTSHMKENYSLVKELSSRLKNLNILNPLAYFQQLDNENQLYFKNDPHLNEEGQTALTQYLIENKLFDEN